MSDNDFSYFFKLLRTHVQEGFSLCDHEFKFFFNYIQKEYPDYINLHENVFRFIRVRNLDSLDRNRLVSKNQSWAKNKEGIEKFCRNEEAYNEYGFLFSANIVGIDIESLSYDLGIPLKYVDENEILSTKMINYERISEGLFTDTLSDIKY